MKPSIQWRPNPLWHATPIVHDAVGGYETEIIRRTSAGRTLTFGDAALYLWFGTEHQMTEEQRLAYNVRQLGVTGAAEYERSETERRNKRLAK